jgi:hypothetical protein
MTLTDKAPEFHKRAILAAERLAPHRAYPRQAGAGEAHRAHESLHATAGREAAAGQGSDHLRRWLRPDRTCRMNPCPACGQVHHRRIEDDKPESVVAAVFVAFLMVAAFWLVIAWAVTASV